MIALKLVKQALRVEQDYEGDDELITHYADAARRYVENTTRRKLVVDEDGPEMRAYRARLQGYIACGYLDAPILQEGDPLLVNADVVQAMLMLIAHWYENREAVQFSKVAYVTRLAVDEVLTFHTVFGV